MLLTSFHTYLDVSMERCNDEVLDDELDDLLQVDKGDLDDNEVELVGHQENKKSI